jgi:FMN reductase
MSARRLVVVGLGGGLRANSSTERFLRIALNAAEAAGASTTLLGADALRLPMYEHGAAQNAQARQLIDALRRADGIILASPAYHGTVSGLIKNALDYAEETSGDARPYFADRAVGCMAVAAGWQVAVNTVSTLRGIVHALRGWPTPLGVAINASESPLDPQDQCSSPAVCTQIELMARQVVYFARARTRERHGLLLAVQSPA